MTFFKEIQVGKFVLRFMPSDNGWMCGISKEMMEALEDDAIQEWHKWHKWGRPIVKGEEHMTQDEIIEMAKQAGFEEHQAKFDTRFEPFAKLVAEKEREACWQIACDYTQKFNSHTCLAVADAIRARGQA